MGVLALGDNGRLDVGAMREWCLCNSDDSLRFAVVGQIVLLLLLLQAVLQVVVVARASVKESTLEVQDPGGCFGGVVGCGRDSLEL